jgi:hypothetical protein
VSAPVEPRTRADPTRRALVVWLATRVLLGLAALGAAVVSGAGAGAWLSRWDRWDVGLFRKVAEFGYDGYPHDYPDVGIVAFFPGHPLLLRAVHVVVPDWTAAGLLLSLVAGGVAAVALARLAEAEMPGAGPWAVACLALSPYGVFLVAGYSEALFLAFALPAWLAARSHRWMLAGLLGAGAASVRVTGLFLAVALLVHCASVCSAAGRRPGADAAWLLAPFAAAAAYVGYLRVRTGSWLAWPQAQAEGWERELTAPWTSLATTLRAATSDLPPEYVWAFRAEVVAVAVGVALTGLLLRRRRWAESTYVGLSVVSLATSTYYLSVPRAALLWWPLWVLLAAAAVRRREVGVVYLVVAVPLCLLGVVVFTSGRWLG